MLIKRKITVQVLESAKHFPVVAIMGPRQSGKTTLTQTTFPNHTYVSLEDHDIRDIARNDPRKFLTDYPSKAGLILDEIQQAPELLSYIQTIVDREKKNGFFIVTGSQNFLVDAAITQSLAGRMAVLTLLPLSIQELKDAGLLPETIEALVHAGSYPKAHVHDTPTQSLYTNYIRLYVERDVRQLRNITDLHAFQTFMKLCAGRIGQVVNLTSLGDDCGVDHKTIKAWLSVLEASYIIFLLHPYYKNFGKRLIKAPKLYFIDTGLACSLLNIRSIEELQNHYLRGGLVESLIMSDLLKQEYNQDQRPNLYFWRDHMGNELDCIVDTGLYPVPIEIKAGKTVNTDFFKNFTYWQETTGTKYDQRYLVYGGNEDQKRTMADVLSWKNSGTLIETIDEVRATYMKQQRKPEE